MKHQYILIVNKKDNRELSYMLSSIDRIEHDHILFEGKKKKPAFIIYFKDGRTSTLQSNNWIIHFEL